jgi:epoxyqueuosine reductase
VSRLAALTRAAAAERLMVAGLAPILPEDGLQRGLRTAVLLAPDEPAFWPHHQASPEGRDGRPDPVDRWSRRVIGRIACAAGVKAAFPFGGPPYRPFIGWALRSGRCHTSPVTLLVHDVAGLFISFRGAFLLPEELAPDPRPSPCTTCDGQPCRSACPVGALTAQGYDVAPCHAYLDTGPGADCLTGGCRVRRACPVGAGRRAAAQSAHHMRHFHRPR